MYVCSLLTLFRNLDYHEVSLFELLICQFMSLLLLNDLFNSLCFFNTIRSVGLGSWIGSRSWRIGLQLLILLVICILCNIILKYKSREYHIRKLDSWPCSGNSYSISVSTVFRELFILVMDGFMAFDILKVMFESFMNLFLIIFLL